MGAGEYMHMPKTMAVGQNAGSGRCQLQDDTHHRRARLHGRASKCERPSSQLQSQGSIEDTATAAVYLWAGSSQGPARQTLRVIVQAADRCDVVTAPCVAVAGVRPCLGPRRRAPSSACCAGSPWPRPTTSAVLVLARRASARIVVHPLCERPALQRTRPLAAAGSTSE